MRTSLPGRKIAKVLKEGGEDKLREGRLKVEVDRPKEDGEQKEGSKNQKRGEFLKKTRKNFFVDFEIEGREKKVKSKGGKLEGNRDFNSKGKA